MQSALALLHGSIEELKKIEKNEDALGSSDLGELLNKFENRLQSLLKKLVKFCLNKQSDDKSVETYKSIYTMALRSTKNKENIKLFSQHLRDILENVKKSLV